MDYIENKLVQTHTAQSIRLAKIKSEFPNVYKALLYHNIKLKMIWDFCYHANLCGLAIPEKMDFFDYEIHREPNILFPGIPKEDAFKQRLLNNHPTSPKPTLSTGLAQHHGIPTRLLDFTLDPLRAIYFASLGQGYSDIWVWAIKLSNFGEAMVEHKKFITDEKKVKPLLSQYSVAIMPSASNSYLYNQRGIFLYPKHANEYLLEFGKHPDLKDFMEAYYGDAKHQLTQIVLTRIHMDKLKYF
ncbi:FRG domain-containing protein [Dyadobacter subterraneus]